MKIVVDVKSAEPLNEQIRTQIIRCITDGSIKADECLPSIRFVARTLKVGVITVKTAYEKLEEDGYIYTVAGKGCFVSRNAEKHADKKTDLVLSRLKPAVEYARSLGVSKQEFAALVDTLYGGEEK